jgi:chlorobactene glucosyltransferase
MLALFSGATWAGVVIYMLSRALRQFRAYREAALVPVVGSVDQPAVSIIVPVRDEIDNIDLCLTGLVGQSCLNDRSPIIVVDDDSQDGTRAAVEPYVNRDPRIRLVTAGALPDGWIGKPHACWQGAALAEGDWLCFIDADVRTAPELIAAAVANAEAHGIDMLSLQPLQELGSFWERVIIPAGLLMIACAKPFTIASEECVNGQFLLIRRETYFRVGGHAAVRAEICEDKALASRVEQAGFCFRVLAAEDLARTRMYRDFRSLWEGLSKNATEILGTARATLIAAAAALVFGWSALLLPIGICVAALTNPSPDAVVGAALALLGSAVVIGIQFGTAAHFRIPPFFGLSFPLGYTAAACLALHSVFVHVKGRVSWKGRTYQLRKPSPQRL